MRKPRRVKMRAKLERFKKEQYLTIIPETRKERNNLEELWKQLPDIKFEKRGSITGSIPIKEHCFTIAIIKEKEK
jgi:hypothetical protein